MFGSPALLMAYLLLVSILYIWLDQYVAGTWLCVMYHILSYYMDSISYCGNNFGCNKYNGNKFLVCVKIECKIQAHTVMVMLC